MRCLVTGAYGFIGSHVCRALARRGAEVIGAGRDVALGRRLLPDLAWIACDFNTDLSPEVWRPRLDGMDAIVNCVGILQSSRTDRSERIEVGATAALFEAAAQAGIQRFVHLSAMSVEDEIATDYARFKLAAERTLQTTDLNWLIIKPSLVVGSGSYGGTSMIRGLAGLPYVTPLPGGGRQVFQPIAMTDLAEGIARLAEADAPKRTTLYAPGPETVTLGEVVVKTRRWLGFPEARAVAIPEPVIRAGLRLGDVWVWLGNRTALCTTAFRQMAYRETIDPAPFAAATGLTLKTLDATLLETPATLQDRLHARLSWAGFGLRLGLAASWIWNGVLVLWPPLLAAIFKTSWEINLSQMALLVVAFGGTLVELICGILFLRDRWVRPAGRTLIAVYLLFLVAAAVYAVGWGANLFYLHLDMVVVKILAVAVVLGLAEER
ncbi:MAG: NAD-dependent epimerase/dehydratase family protein [Methyloligellaceae bacterium]